MYHVAEPEVLAISWGVEEWLMMLPTPSYQWIIRQGWYQPIGDGDREEEVGTRKSARKELE